MSDKPPSTLLSPDNPIRYARDDLLEWEPIATDFARRVLRIDATQGLVVGLFGSWGSGKTSFINLACPEFEGKEIPVLDFNPWLFSGADQLLARFFVELSAAMGESSNLKAIGGYFKTYGHFLSTAAVPIATLTGNPHFEWLLSILQKFVQKVLSRPESPTNALAARKKLTDLLKQRTKPIVVVLDDVDRLSRDEIRELFKLVRVTANFPNLIYIVACDRNRVEEALEDGDKRFRGNFLEKIFQWSIDIPVASRERIHQELLSGIESALVDAVPPFDELHWPDVEAEIIGPLVRNMRDVRRYTMAAHGTIDSLGGSIDLVDTLALEAIRLFMPQLFEQLPRLVDHLTVAPNWEANEERVADIISEQMGDTEAAAKLRQANLERVLDALDAYDRPVARALVHRVFAGGRGGHDNHDSEWPIQQLRNNRIVHRIIFRLYFTRVQDGDLTSYHCAKRAFECLHSSQTLSELLRKEDARTWSTVVLLLWSIFRDEFETRYAEPGLVVFWNLLSDMPGRSPAVQDEPMKIVGILTESLLETLLGTDSGSDTIKSVFHQIQSLTSKLAFLAQVKALNVEKSPLISDIELHTLEESLNNQILSVTSDDLIAERHPAQVLLFSAQRADPPKIPLVVHDSPRLTFALIWDCLTTVTTVEFGSRTNETRLDVRWEKLIAIHGNEEMLRTRIDNLVRDFSGIESWIVSELGVQSTDARDLLQQAKEHVSESR